MSKIDYNLSLIKAFVFDVDGVLSPATVAIDADGEPNRMTSVHDGYAIRRATESGYCMAIITGGKTPNVVSRHNKLGITDVYSGISDKLPCLIKWMDAHGLKPDEVAYMGDDIPDLSCMRYVGLPCAPYDARNEALQSARFISKFSGGYGCVRDLIEQVMRAQGKWHTSSLTPAELQK